jgi:plastocyanin
MRGLTRGLALVALAALTATGCGASDQGSPSSSQTGGSEAVRVQVRIENGEVTPSGDRVDVEVGQPIQFVVDSDTADEIHVHSTPEHSFAFQAGAENRTFEFRLNQPGVIEAELHEGGDILVTFAARP